MIIKLLEELKEANQALTSAKERASVAKSAEVSAANKVNNIQKKIDEAIAEMKKSSPHDTDWHREWLKTKRVIKE